MIVPFHKQTNPNKQAGQVVFSPPVPNTGFDREPYLKHSNVAPDVTLSDYIKRKEEGPQRFTFTEWWDNVGRELHGNYYREVYEEVWTIALTKGKL